MHLVKSLVVLLSALLAGCGQPKPQLNLLIWSEYIDPKIIGDFERLFGCKVNIDFHEDPDSMIAKLAAGGSSRYDIVVPSNHTLPTLVKRGLLVPLRHENIPNLKNIDPQFANPAFDPDNRYGAPFQWGTTGIYLRKSADKPVDETWGLIFDASKQSGAFLLVEDIRSCFGAALIYKGYRFNSIDPKELLEARDLLVEAKKRSLGFEGSTGCKNRVLSKGAMLAMAYNSDAVRGLMEDSATHYFVPREGGEKWVDALSIPSHAPHRLLAEKFINYLLEPEVGARVSSFSRAATPNRAALDFINPDDRKNPAIYPPAEIMQRLEYATDLGAKNQLYDELWTQVKSK